MPIKSSIPVPRYGKKGVTAEGPVINAKLPKAPDAARLPTKAAITAEATRKVNTPTRSRQPGCSDGYSSGSWGETPPFSVTWLLCIQTSKPLSSNCRGHLGRAHGGP